jgi:diguanylate cyclase (GGDEF)-like protein/PAS domain S-box-containing protein
VLGADLPTVGEGVTGFSPEGARILVVDDEPLLRDSLCAILRRSGYDVFPCASGQEALASLMAGGIDLILLDLHLGDLDGLDLLGMIRSASVDTAVIVISGDTMVESAIGALRLGASDYLRKPYEVEVLLHTVRRVVQRRYLERTNREIARQLEYSENLHRFLVEASPDLIFTLDDQFRFSFVNDRAVDLVGFAPQELQGRTLLSVVAPQDVDKLRYVLARVDSGQRQVEFRIFRGDHQSDERHFDAVLVPARFTAATNGANRGYTSCIYGLARDVSDRKSAEERLAHLAYHDALTGLPNRALFCDRLGLAMVQARRSGTKVAVMFVDLDRFKLANDTFGHQQGDQLLRQVAQRLQGGLRETDTLARLGGDEFIVLLTGLNQPEDAGIVAHKLVTDMAVPFMIEGSDVFLTASIGVAIFPRDGDDIETLVRHADIAMYHVKSQGKNGFGYFLPDMGEISSRRFALENEIRRAIEHNQFDLFYQPQVDSESRRVIGCEALIRWHHPEKGTVPAGAFLPVVEEIGLMSSLTDWVIERACRDLNAWRDAGMELPRMAVNISPAVLEDADFGDRLITLLNRYDIDPDAFEIELTENVFIADQETISSRLESLARSGIRIAIDDFGTQYSSLSYLRNLPVNTIKIDQCFVREIEQGREDSTIIRAIVAIAAGLGLHVVAEGVETSLQANFLKAVGAREMQGFLFGRPMVREEFTRLLGQNLVFAH